MYVFDDFDLIGFHEILRKYRGFAGGGVAVFIRNSVPYKRIYKYGKTDVEAIWVQINSIEWRILICCCYWPPDTANFWTDFSHVLDEVKGDQVNNIFILGNLNADFQSANGHKLRQLCDTQNHLTYLVEKTTRITDRSSTVLDQILINAPNFVKRVEVSPPVSTTCNDYCTIGVHLNFKISKELSYQRTIWLYKEANFEEYHQAMNKC